MTSALDRPTAIARIDYLLGLRRDLVITGACPFCHENIIVPPVETGDCICHYGSLCGTGCAGAHHDGCPFAGPQYAMVAHPEHCPLTYASDAEMLAEMYNVKLVVEIVSFTRDGLRIAAVLTKRGDTDDGE